MIASILSIILFLVFSVLSGFHFYWFFGGKWGLDKVIPSVGEKANSLEIPKFATLIVALGLMLFGLLYLGISGLITIQFPKWVTNYAYWFIPAIFTFRAIGEFKYVGFFKKIRNTEFARADSKIFAPLCIGIGIAGFVIQLL